MYYTRTKLGKINPENVLRNAKQEFPCQSSEILSGEYYNMENKILDFRSGPVCADQIRPNCSNLSKVQYDRWSTPEWRNWEKCEKISTS